MPTTRPAVRTKTAVLTSVVALALSVLALPVAAEPDDPVTDETPPLETTVTADGLTAPVWGTHAPGHDSTIHVADQVGIVWSIDLTAGTRAVFLDVSDRLVALGVAGPGTFDERGLLGLAFHPSYSQNGLVYTYTSEPVAGPADFSTMPVGESANHQSVIAEWEVPEPTNPNAVPDPDSRREILRIDQPQFNHNGGALVFDGNGMLLVALGDGGGADDQGVGHVPGGNGQDAGNVLGTILRIDPLGSDSTNGQYGIPADNPFVGDSERLDEIWAYGFRNPFRITFDEATGALIAADVGQNDIEEVDLVERGGNHGWPIKEGSACFDPNGEDPGFAFVADPCPSEPDGLVEPIVDYTHADGIAVIGGFVYRGTEIPWLRGRYVFGDFLAPSEGRGRIFRLDRPVPGLRPGTRILEPQLQIPLEGLTVLGFGQSADGEVHILANRTGTPFGDTGVVLRLGH